MKKILSLTLLALVTLLAQAQMVNPVKFSSHLKMNGTAEAEIIFSGKIEKGWHVYSTGLGDNGPVQASFNVNKLDGVELVGKLKPRGHEISTYDKLFDMNLRYFEHSATFVQKVRFTKPHYTIDAYLEYGACNDQNCMPPSEVSIKSSGKSPAVAGAAEKQEETAAEKAAEAAANGEPMADTTALVQNGDSVAATALAVDTTGINEGQLWKPVVKELQSMSGVNDIANMSIWYIFLMGIVGGLLALVMPCIWPIIPMTVSFFLKRAKDDRRRGIRSLIGHLVDFKA